ncbi:hypothetical protein PHLCEN_2v10548 [Hermanssonia centrifuga]|uniref:Uncharacterized protein n=1 Tax=Hermanssonia centrifuga TaxID=98765 RepID=A0A2R6NMK3_9APHY|nr:hypothetical protein PHLCEN_2v10548 [Hermanssonia centrifuga]
MEPEKRRHRARFSPYSPAISHIRRGSLPSVAQLGEAESRPSRVSDTEITHNCPNPDLRFQALSTSPRSMSPQRIVGKQRSSTFGSSSARRPAKLTLDADLVANTPISTFLRRKTPQSSPISPTFPHRFKRSSSPSLPVSIPTLPTFFFPPVTIIPSLSSDTDDDMMSDTSSTRVEAPRKRRKPRVGRHRSSSGLRLERHGSC